MASLPRAAAERIASVLANGHAVVVGDADGADAAVQRRLRDAGASAVTVFCSAGRCRANLGVWPLREFSPPPGARGFQVHAAKDRGMALAADFGLMVWDGRSFGTLLNVLRLCRAGKPCVVIEASPPRTRTFRSMADWDAILQGMDARMRSGLRERATAEEWNGAPPPAPPPQPLLL